MRLWKRNESPVGSWYYILDDGTRVPLSGYATSLTNLIYQVELRMEAKGMLIPEYIADLVEDQICTRQPPGRCRIAGVGDLIGKGISAAAGAIDALTGTKLKVASKKCGMCGKRRVKLNQLSR